MSIKLKRIEALRIFTDVLAKLDALFASANLPGADILVEISHSRTDEVLEFHYGPSGRFVTLHNTLQNDVTRLLVSTYSPVEGNSVEGYDQPVEMPDEDTRAYNALCVARLLFRALTGKEATNG
jgi:hypothetical protein